MENSATEPSAPATRPPTLLDRLLVNRNFALFWLGEVISTLGDYSFSITLTFWILLLADNAPWAPLAIVGLVFSSSLPVLFLGPIIGVFVDRMDRLRTMIISNVVQGSLVFALFLTTFWPGGHLPIAWQIGAIYLANFLLITADQFFNQAGNPLLGDIVPDEDFARAIGRVLTYVYLGTIIGPTIGAFAFPVFGAQITLLLNVLTFVFSNAMLIFVRVPKAAPSTTEESITATEVPQAAPAKKKNRFAKEFSEGARFVFSSPVIRTMLFAMALETLGTAALPVANAFFVTGNLHASVSFLGYLTAALGLGAVLGSVFGPPLAKRLGEARLFWICLVADGVFLIIYARLTNIWAGMAVIFILGIIAALFNLAFGPLVLRLTPRDMMGRTTAVRVSFVTSAGLIGAAAAGALIGLGLANGFKFDILNVDFGTVDSVLVVAGIISLLSGIFAMKTVVEPSKPIVAPASPVEIAEVIARPEGIIE